MLQYLMHVGNSQLNANSKYELALQIKAYPLAIFNLDFILNKLKLDESFKSVLLIEYLNMEVAGLKAALPSALSELAIKLAELYQRGKEVFTDDSSSFVNWLHSDIIALGGNKPKEFLYSIIGIEVIMEELIRIEHSVY